MMEKGQCSLLQKQSQVEIVFAARYRSLAVPPRSVAGTRVSS
jgi:hypothetical protein